MMPNLLQSPRKILFIVGGLFAAMILAAIVQYVATHGFVSVKNASGDKLSLININESLSDKQEVSNGAIVTSGTYAVRNDVDGRLRLANVTVPGWLQTAQITFDAPVNHPIKRVAALTNGALVGRVGSLRSYDSALPMLSELATHPTGDVFGLDVGNQPLSTQLYRPQLFNGTSLIGFVGGEEEGTEGAGPLATYDVTTGTVTKLTDNSFTPDDTQFFASRSPGNDGLLVYDKVFGTYTYYKNGVSSEIKLQTPAAFDDVVPILDINGDMLAVLSGENFVPSTSDGAPALEKDSVVTLYSLTTGKKTSSYTIRKSNKISEIAVSKDGSVATIDNDLLWVYDKSGTLTLTNPFETTSQVFWRDNTNLYALSADNNVTRVDTQKKHLTSVFSAGTLGVSAAHIDGNMLYFTAFNNKNPVSSLPDGYVVDLGTTSNNRYSETVVNKLPLGNNDYQINVIDSTIVIELATTSREGTDPVLYDKEVAAKEVRARQALESAVGKEALGAYTVRVTTTN